MNDLPKLSDYVSADEFISAFEIYMDCFLISKSIASEDHESVKLKFLKLILSKAAGYHALGVDGRTTFQSLAGKIHLLIQSTSTPMKDFFALDCSRFANATDYIVKAKSLLSSFVSDEVVKELLIAQRLKELLPPDAALLLTEETPRFDCFVKHMQAMWKLVQSSDQVCAASTKAIRDKNDTVSRRKCYSCGSFWHIARNCPQTRKTYLKNESG